MQIIQHQEDLLTLNRGVALALVQEVDALVDTARTSADDATEASTQAILTGRTLLLAISALSVVGALLIAWAVCRPHAAQANSDALGLDAPHGGLVIWNPE